MPASAAEAALFEAELAQWNAYAPVFFETVSAIFSEIPRFQKRVRKEALCLPFVHLLLEHQLISENELTKNGAVMPN